MLKAQGIKDPKTGKTPDAEEAMGAISEAADMLLQGKTWDAKQGKYATKAEKEEKKIAGQQTLPEEKEDVCQQDGQKEA
jgi:hypothetical protein